jgi:uncharacterized membrane protein YqaE (UPF0057 family)
VIWRSLSRWLRSVLAVVLAFVVPPASVVLTRGVGAAFAFSLLLTASGPLVYRYLFAGPGLILYLLAVIQAVTFAFWSRQSGTTPAAAG